MMTTSTNQSDHVFDLKISTGDGSSPKYSYMPLSPVARSPKHGVLSRANLSLMILLFGVGVLLGGMSNHLRLPKAPESVPKTHDSVPKINRFHPSLRKDDADDSLKVAFLMSFPNSGTSYTSRLVRTVTGHNTASNYGLETPGEDGKSAPVFDFSPEGPFWSQPTDARITRPTKGYLLTKTHCGGRCDKCSTDKYIETHQTFLQRCLEGEYTTGDGSGGLQVLRGHYDKSMVRKAVHLIRDPFDNIVSRFHLAHNRLKKRGHNKSVEKYSKSREGFRAFCSDLAETYRSDEEESRFYADVLDDAKEVPCHADFFRYVQWHNLAFATTWDLGIPAMILHYENYTTNFMETKHLLLEFLDQEDNNPPPEFIMGKTYRDYFTEDEVHAVNRMFSKLALETTWNHTKHYFY
mmetsp:Transcript_15856/g.33163  ORF Transcript_15856/g.33163 Transcript_15856/m.33163 type:complete len:407 (-) Transcript_15856:288-1508(-)